MFYFVLLWTGDAHLAKQISQIQPGEYNIAVEWMQVDAATFFSSLND